MPYLGLIGVENLRAGPLPLSASGHCSCSSMYLSRRCPSLRFGISWYGGKRRTKPERYGFLREHALHSLAGRAAPEAHVADP